MSHGSFVLRGAPQVHFGLMTAGAGFTADERGGAVIRGTRHRHVQKLPNTSEQKNQYRRHGAGGQDSVSAAKIHAGRITWAKISRPSPSEGR
jgi:hypothetical protein